MVKKVDDLIDSFDVCEAEASFVRKKISKNRNMASNRDTCCHTLTFCIFSPLRAVDHHIELEIDCSSQEVSNAALEGFSHLPMMVTRIPFPWGPQSAMFSAPVLFAALIFSSATQVIAHEHHDDEIPEGEAISADPIVAFQPLPPP